MYEPITIVKVRTETKVTVPAGGWILIGQPNEPLHTQIARRAAMINAGVNDDYEKLIIGRVQASHPVTTFPSQASLAAAKKEAIARDATLAKSLKDADEREKKAADDAVKATEKARAAKMEAINAENDSIRTRNGAPAAPAPGLKIETGN